MQNFLIFLYIGILAICLHPINTIGVNPIPKIGEGLIINDARIRESIDKSSMHFNNLKSFQP